MRIKNTTLWLTGCALAFGLSISLAGYIGFSQSMKVMTAPAPGPLVSSVVPLPPAVHDPKKPTVAVLLGNTLSEPTDVLGPYAMFAESGKYNVYTVADSRSVRTLTGGLDLVPHLSFEELAARLHGDPDILVVPQIADIRASINAPVVAWVRRQRHGHALLFSWCTGAEVLAESGVIDGKAATAHWGDIDRLQRVYPRVLWQRGVRYVDGGTLLSTAGLTAGVDATLHLLARRDGAELAAKVAQALHIPPSRFVENPKCRQFEFAPSDAIFLLNAGFRWPKPRLSVWLHDGVAELDLGSIADVYGVSAAYQLHTLSAAASVVSSHGVQFVPRERVRTVPAMVLRREESPKFAYIAAIEDLARHQDAWTARFTAKRLEIRTPLRIEGASWSIGVVLTPLIIGCATLAFLFWLKRAVQEQRPGGLELKVPPVAFGLIAAALMWCATSAAPDFDFLLTVWPKYSSAMGWCSTATIDSSCRTIAGHGYWHTSQASSISAFSFSANTSLQRTGSCNRTCPAESGSPTPSGAHWLKSANGSAGSCSPMSPMSPKPETILGWYRRLIARKFDGSKHRSSPGRPQVSPEVQSLIVRMAQETGLGATIGSPALSQISATTSPTRLSQTCLGATAFRLRGKRSQTTTWKDFISAHMAVLAGSDFFTVEVLSWRGLATYYVLFFLHLETRRITLAGITRHPTEAWITPMAVMPSTTPAERRHRVVMCCTTEMRTSVRPSMMCWHPRASAL